MKLYRAERNAERLEHIIMLKAQMTDLKPRIERLLKKEEKKMIFPHKEQSSNQRNWLFQLKIQLNEWKELRKNMQQKVEKVLENGKTKH